MKNRSLTVLILINLIFVFGATLLGPLYAVYVQEQIGKDILTIGWAFAVYMMTIGVFTYLAGKWADRVKEKEYFIAAGYIIRALGFFLYTIIGTVFQLLLVQVLLGIGEAIANPAFKSIYSVHLDKGKESTEWGIWDMSFSFTVGTAAIVGAFIVHVLGFNTLFYSMSVLSIFAFILLIIQQRELL